MGLAISQTIIEQHQGRISAGNCPDGGAIVSFCLPLAACPKTGVVVEASNLTVIFPVGSQLSA
jgi:K+-sensing histidine kinase KdpD